MQILIVDDEAPARARLRRLLEEMEDLTSQSEAADGKTAVQQAFRQPPDVVLLDIRMPGMDGLEAASHLGKMANPPAVIFTTAYEQHALDAFELHAVDYLLKPISREGLSRALERARALQQGKIQLLRAKLSGRRTHVSAFSHNGMRLAPVAEIRFFKADRKYVRACRPGEELLLEESLRALGKEFGDLFLRVHRNALAAPRHLRALENNSKHGALLSFHGVEEKLPVSRRLQPAVRKLLRASKLE